MNRIQIAAILAVMAFPILVLAQDAAPVDPIPPDAGVSKDVGVKEIVDKGTEVVGAIKNLADKEQREKKGTWPLVAFLVAAFLKFALTLVRKFGYLLGKQTLRITLLVIGALLFLFGKFAMGASVWDALVLAAAGPGAMWFHEALKLIQPGKWAKEADVVKERKAEA